jgi:L-ascorbate metabolism protein UlaG (beta-lactamase superfamily)
VTGDVTGFVLSSDSSPTVYVSGDNASLDLVKEIAGRFPEIDVAVLFAGAARTVLLDGAALTLTSADAVEAARLLDAKAVIGVHTEGWAHFTEGPDRFIAAFQEAGLADRLKPLQHGVTATLD